jgi:hypothetical protein
LPTRSRSRPTAWCVPSPSPVRRSDHLVHGHGASGRAGRHRCAVRQGRHLNRFPRVGTVEGPARPPGSAADGPDPRARPSPDGERPGRAHRERGGSELARIGWRDTVPLSPSPTVGRQASLRCHAAVVVYLTHYRPGQS